MSKITPLLVLAVMACFATAANAEDTAPASTSTAATATADVDVALPDDVTEKDYPGLRKRWQNLSPEAKRKYLAEHPDLQKRIQAARKKHARMKEARMDNAKEERREARKERMENMSPEEREAMKARMEERRAERRDRRVLRKERHHDAVEEHRDSTPSTVRPSAGGDRR